MEQATQQQNTKTYFYNEYSTFSVLSNKLHIQAQLVLSLAEDLQTLSSPDLLAKQGAKLHNTAVKS